MCNAKKEVSVNIPAFYSSLLSTTVHLNADENGNVDKYFSGFKSSCIAQPCINTETMKIFSLNAFKSNFIK